MTPAMDDARTPYLGEQYAGRKHRPHSAPVPTIWQRAGVLVGYPVSTDPAMVVRKALENHFSWVAVKVHDGTKIEPGAAEFIREMRATWNGLTVIGWGVQQYEPI